MRFFTRAWHSGELPDSEAEAVPDAYRRHIEALTTTLPAGVRALAEGLNLHDGRIRRITLDADARAVRLELRCGDRTTGYEDVVVTYVDAELEPTALAALRDATNDRSTEVLCGEVDVAARRRFSHHLLFWPYREAELTFHDVVIERAPAAGRDFAAVEPRWIEIQAAATQRALQQPGDLAIAHAAHALLFDSPAAQLVRYAARLAPEPESFADAPLLVALVFALAGAVHVDWHFARSTHHRLSLGWNQHWVFAALAFGLVGWVVART